MNQYVYEIKGEPVSWSAHKGYGKYAYSTHAKAKFYAQCQLRCQNNGRPLIERAVRVDFFFEMPIPKSFTKKKRALIASEFRVWHKGKKDRSNLEKFAADCLIGTVLLDDNIIVAGETQKYYSSGEPKTIIVVQEIEDD